MRDDYTWEMQGTHVRRRIESPCTCRAWGGGGGKERCVFSQVEDRKTTTNRRVFAFSTQLSHHTVCTSIRHIIGTGRSSVATSHARPKKFSAGIVRLGVKATPPPRTRGVTTMFLLRFFYTKRAHVKQAFFSSFAPHLKIIANARSVRTNLSEVGKKVKRVRHLPFFAKSVHSGGQKSFKTHIFGRFRILFFQKSVNLVTRKSEENKNVLAVFWSHAAFSSVTKPNPNRAPYVYEMKAPKKPV